MENRTEPPAALLPCPSLAALHILCHSSVISPLMYSASSHLLQCIVQLLEDGSRVVGCVVDGLVVAFTTAAAIVRPRPMLVCDVVDGDELAVALTLEDKCRARLGDAHLRREVRGEGAALECGQGGGDQTSTLAGASMIQGRGSSVGRERADGLQRGEGTEPGDNPTTVR